MKLIVDADSSVVVGCHMVGDDSAEIMQVGGWVWQKGRVGGGGGGGGGAGAPARAPPPPGGGRSFGLVGMVLCLCWLLDPWIAESQPPTLLFTWALDACRILHAVLVRYLHPVRCLLLV
jgi:hypothetical protein